MRSIEVGATMKLYPDYNENGMVVAYYRYSSSSQNEASIE